jgi:hypothetical protein
MLPSVFSGGVYCDMDARDWLLRKSGLDSLSATPLPLA